MHRSTVAESSLRSGTCTVPGTRRLRPESVTRLRPKPLATSPTAVTMSSTSWLTFGVIRRRWNIRII